MPLLTMNRSKTGIILLAGGKSRRFGGDKAFFSFHGQPLIQRMLNKVRSISSDIIIVANWRIRPNFLSDPVYHDLIPKTGPLGGIYTGLVYSKCTRNLVLPCDMPGMSTECLCYLLEKGAKADIAVACYQNRVEPLCAVYSKNCIPVIRKQLIQKNLQIQQLFKSVNTKKIHITAQLPFYHRQLFFNLNSREDLLLFELSNC